MVIFVWEVRMLAWGRNKVSEAISRGRAKGVGWLQRGLAPTFNLYSEWEAGERFRDVRQRLNHVQRFQSCVS